jgi:hypothetical protein
MEFFFLCLFCSVVEAISFTIAITVRGWRIALSNGLNRVGVLLRPREEENRYCLRNVVLFLFI